MIRKYLTNCYSHSRIRASYFLCKYYCNSLMYGLPSYQIDKLQRVQNSAACQVGLYGSKVCSHQSFLKELHWLPVKYQIEFKILTLTFQGIHGLVPEYLCDLIQIRELPNYSLQTTNEIVFVVPSHKSLSIIRGREFKLAAPKLWNRLPKYLKH